MGAGRDWGYLAILYVFVQLSRVVVVGLLYPGLKYFGYGLNWKEAVVLVWAGLRGAVALSLSLSVAVSTHANSKRSCWAFCNCLSDAMHDKGYIKLTGVLHWQQVGEENSLNYRYISKVTEARVRVCSWVLSSGCLNLLCSVLAVNLNHQQMLELLELSCKPFFLFVDVECLFDGLGITYLYDTHIVEYIMSEQTREIGREGKWL